MILTEKERNEVKAFAVESNERHPSATSALMLGKMTLKFRDRCFWIHNRNILPATVRMRGWTTTCGTALESGMRPCSLIR